MQRRPVLAILLVSVMGVGLHLGFRGLAGELPRLFPRIAGETPQEVVPLPALPEINPEEFPPPQAPKLSELSDIDDIPSPPAAQRIGEGTVRVLRSTSIPLLPPPRLEQRLLGETFEVPPDLQPAVDFWKKIYTTYDTHQVLIHDTDHLQIQYSVLDFTTLDEKPISDAQKNSIRSEAVSREMERISGILAELAHPDLQRGPLSKESQRIAQLFTFIEDPDKFETARQNLRAQTGLKNRFIEGLQNAGKYLPLFEEIFQNYGIPVEISRLAFVESLFKEKSFSKAGAAGLWQFMPGTAKKYMVVDRLVDERYDPIIATHAAARLLLKNYELLGSWPLAINAYNSGTGNLLRAISQLGTREISTIIRNFRSGSYAFASRNFYPQFLAVLDSYENQERYFGKVERESPLEFDLVQLPATMTFPEIAYLADVPIDALQELNPAFAPTVFAGNYSMPAGSQVRIPTGQHGLFSARFVDYFTESEGGPPLFHIVAAGETLRGIASRYHLNPLDLQRINLSNISINPGRVLLIPSLSRMARNKGSF